MAQESPIEWTDATWNPVTGCTKISPGCKNGCAHRMARRLHAMGQARYWNNLAVTLLSRLSLQGIQWVIVGGESGPGARAVDPRWVRKIRDRCIAHGVPFFFKQWGGTRKKLTGRELDGRTWDEMPGLESERSKRVSG